MIGEVGFCRCGGVPLASEPMAPPLCIHLRTDQPTNHPPSPPPPPNPRIEPPFAPPDAPRARNPPSVVLQVPSPLKHRVSAKVFLPFIYLIELRNAISHERNPNLPTASSFRSHSRSLFLSLPLSLPLSRCFSPNPLPHPSLSNSSSDNASEIPPREFHRESNVISFGYTEMRLIAR